jgi:hypothetical protein
MISRDEWHFHASACLRAMLLLGAYGGCRHKIRDNRVEDVALRKLFLLAVQS